MSVVKLCRLRVPSPLAQNIKCCSQDYSTEVVSRNVPDAAVYPEILDPSKEAKKFRDYQALAESIRNIKTVEEKLLKLNMPKYYGWKCIMLNEHFIPLGCLPFIQHVTRTQLVKGAGLSDAYLPYDTAASFITKQISSDVQDTIQFEYQGVRREFDFSKDKKTPERVQQEDAQAAIIIEKINRLISNHLAPTVPHLTDSQLDIEPRHEAFWFSGGFPWKQTTNKMTKGIKWQIVDHPMQYIGKPVLSLRSPFPLEPLPPLSAPSNIPHYPLDPRTLSYTHTYRHGTNVPGFWPGDSHEFGLISFHTRGHLLNIPTSFPADHVNKALDAQGILNSFGWLLSQASYQGFDTYNDLTYPLVTQTVITNGQYWSFFTYQMNTVCTYNNLYETNPNCNVCYSTGPIKLFEGIDDNGKLIGFNDDVLKMLVQLYINTPAVRKGTDMKPYLDQECNTVAGIEDDEKRNWLEKTFKHVSSNRPRHRLPDEVYHWEWIYKIKFDSRWGDNTRRFFDYPGLKHPHERRLDEHQPHYIPKAFQKEGFKSLVKWEKTYYP